ncbi:MAG: hypothetical protein ACK5NT_14890 [Pyrinomonadaceae bacterium]
MSEKLQPTNKTVRKERVQYGATFALIAMMLYVVGFPLMVIFFFGIFAYFIWLTFSSPNYDNSANIFDFYISANSILRDGNRKFFGFEVVEAIEHGERIIFEMHGAPPLVYFALGALNERAQRYDQAARMLSYVVEDEHSDESAYLHPSSELRTYVSILRKIEQNPEDAPLTSAAIRSLERMRKREAAELLRTSRARLEANANYMQEPALPENNSVIERVSLQENSVFESEATLFGKQKRTESDRREIHDKKDLEFDERHEHRKPISEVLRDIYDKNIQ